MDIANKYTDLSEMTPEALRTIIEQIIIHEITAKRSKSTTQQIDIGFRYIGFCLFALSKYTKFLKSNI
ncbi:MAG: DUF4368 domain-containing protein [Clostridia bacterium]|nr:DUF4368 domain-containing protein [Clostridia bacterium]